MRIATSLLATLIALSFSSPSWANTDSDNGCVPEHREFGDTRIFATVPSPGFPEGMAVRGNKAYVAGPADLFNFGAPPSAVFEYDVCSGALLRTIVVEGQAAGGPRAISHLAFDGAGRLYVADLQRGILRIDLGSGHQQPYSTPFPQINPFVPPLPNEMAFDAAGNLYVTDSLQSVIWRIRPGGGTPEIWFQDPRITSSFGPNGIRLDASGSTLYFVVSVDSETARAGVYTLPLVDSPRPSDLQLFHLYSGFEVPDSLAFGKSGNLYVSLASPATSGISILRPDGAESARIVNAPGSPLSPFDSPACLAFDKKGSILVSNHAFFTRIPQHFLVLDVFVDDTELPLVKPDLP